MAGRIAFVIWEASSLPLVSVDGVDNEPELQNRGTAARVAFPGAGWLDLSLASGGVRFAASSPYQIG